MLQRELKWIKLLNTSIKKISIVSFFVIWNYETFQIIL